MKMEIFTLETGNKIRNVDQEYVSSKMVKFTRVNGKIIILMVLEFLSK